MYETIQHQKLSEVNKIIESPTFEANCIFMFLETHQIQLELVLGK